jgi:hypothetical protein
MRRIKTPQSLGRDYKKMLKDYFGKFLYGLDVKEVGGNVQAQVIYFDFKHIDSVRCELAQMMPEVEFTKLKRDYTLTAIEWVFQQIMWEYPDDRVPEIYVKRGDNLIKTRLRDIAVSELCQLELEDGDIEYAADDEDLSMFSRYSDSDLSSHAQID